MYQRTSILYRIADSFFRHRWLFLMAVLVVSISTMIVVVKRSQKFTATTSLQIVQDTVATDMGVDRNDPWNSPAQQNSGAFNEFKMLPSFLQTVIDKAHLAQPISTRPQDNDPRYNQLTNSLNAYAQSGRLMGVNLVWEDADECNRLVAAAADEFQTEMIGERSASSIKTVQFLDGEIKRIDNLRRDAEKAVEVYKSNNAGALPEAYSNDLAQLANLKAQLDNMRITMADAALRQGVFVQQMERIKPTLIEQTTGVSAYDNVLNTLKAQKQMLLSSGKTPLHPKVQELTSQIADMEKVKQAKQKAGASETSSVKQSTIQQNPQYQAYDMQLQDAKISALTQQKQMQALQAQIAEYEARVKRAPAGLRALSEKQRIYSQYKGQLENMQQQREAFALKTKLQNVSANSVYIPAVPPYAMPVLGTTKLAFMLFASIILGLIVGTVLVVLSEWADRSLRYEADAEHLLGVPVLAMLPETAELRYLPAPGMRAGSRNGNRALPEPQDKPIETKAR